MLSIVLLSLLVLIPLDLLVVYLTLRAGQAEYAQSADEKATISVVTRAFSRYLVFSALIMIPIYLYLTGTIIYTLMFLVIMTSVNLLLIVIIYAVMGSVQSRGFVGRKK